MITVYIKDNDDFDVVDLEDWLNDYQNAEDEYIEIEYKVEIS